MINVRKSEFIYTLSFFFLVKKKPKDLSYFASNNLEPSCEKSLIEKYDNLLDLIPQSHEFEKENSADLKLRVEQPKHARYKSLISKIPKENIVDNNKHKIVKYSQQNKSVDLEKNLELISSKLLSNNLKTPPPDAKVQNKALYGYFFPNSYQHNQSSSINNNSSGSYFFFLFYVFGLFTI